jgi:hypothetical protein
MFPFLWVSELSPASATTFFIYEVVSETSWIVTVVTASVKEDEMEGQGHTSASQFHQSAT